MFKQAVYLGSKACFDRVFGIGREIPSFYYHVVMANFVANTSAKKMLADARP